MRSAVYVCLLMALGLCAAAQTQSPEEKRLRDSCPARNPEVNADQYFEGGKTLFNKGLIGPARCHWIHSSDLGNGLASALLGEMYLDGKTTGQSNFPEALRWYLIGAGRGNVHAQMRSAQLYEAGLGGVTKNHAEAVKWWKEAAAKGNTQAKQFLVTSETTEPSPVGMIGKFLFDSLASGFVLSQSVDATPPKAGGKSEAQAEQKRQKEQNKEQ